MANRKSDGPSQFGGPKPINIVFKLVSLTPIRKGGLLARCKLETCIGLQLTCNVMCAKNDPTKIFVVPVAEKLDNGKYVPLVEFATPELSAAFQKAALEALKPHWDRILPPPANNQQPRAE